MPDGNNSASAKDDAPKIELESDAITGKQINASDPDAAKIKWWIKREVLNHLSSLQNQISDLMKQLLKILTGCLMLFDDAAYDTIR